MAEPPDLSTLAKLYVDLWQDQLVALAAQPELAEGFARLLSAFPVVAWPAPPGGPADPARAAHDSNGATAADRPATAAASSDGGDLLLRELAGRLAALEERLARLEAGIANRGKRPAQSARRRRS